MSHQEHFYMLAVFTSPKSTVITDDETQKDFHSIFAHSQNTNSKQLSRSLAYPSVIKHIGCGRLLRYAQASTQKQILKLLQQKYKYEVV